MSGSSPARRLRRLAYWRGLLLQAQNTVAALKAAHTRPGLPEDIRLQQELKRVEMLAAYDVKIAELERRISQANG